ncbi:hypothetical protein HID58_088079 [Brassica napus]|uniref:Uncharacterized protein n=1 Tax=Brassica napus TaxID=3708 RepID=A0ABQ7XV61_BRANA|nr:hypothetical protein HID58_088079 [Brassica napus]
MMVAGNAEETEDVEAEVEDAENKEAELDAFLYVKLDAFDGDLIRLEVESESIVKKSERVALCLIQGDQQGSRHLRRRLWFCHSVVKQV